jgi:hypothetical protein
MRIFILLTIFTSDVKSVSVRTRRFGFWHDSDPWRIFSTSSRGLWAFPRAPTYIYGITAIVLVEPACATVTSFHSEVRCGFREWVAYLHSEATPGS